MALLVVLAVSQAAGLAGIAILVAAGGEPFPGVGDLLPAAFGGAAGMVALAAFYRGLAIGTMSIVAPISATGAAVPVLVGLSTGDRPGPAVVVGIAVALAGVVLAAREEAPESTAAAELARRSVVLALVAAVGFGAFFVGMDASAGEAGVLWALLGARIASFSLIAAAVLVARPAVPGDPRLLGLLVGIGLLDLGANGCFAAATNEGLLSVASVLGSLYPLVTVLLARLVLGERVRRIQELGIAAALIGVVLIAAG
ncbi:MAG TPA: DMT family transporter [Solirubrobacteraceae bacterium]|nr:DMT family transporter [Solirubrobacteraceae bacterium]